MSQNMCYSPALDGVGVEIYIHVIFTNPKITVMAKTKVDPRYLTYDAKDVERILGSVEHIDDTPTAESDNPVKSGGVAASLANYPTNAQMTAAIAPLTVTEEQFNAIFYPDDSSSSE